MSFNFKVNLKIKPRTPKLIKVMLKIITFITLKLKQILKIKFMRKTSFKNIRKLFLKLKIVTDSNEFLNNFINFSRHIDFSFEVVVIFCVIDIVFIIIDCIDGVCIQTKTILF